MLTFIFTSNPAKSSRTAEGLMPGLEYLCSVEVPATLCIFGWAPGASLQVKHRYVIKFIYFPNHVIYLFPLPCLVIWSSSKWSSQIRLVFPLLSRTRKTQRDGHLKVSSPHTLQTLYALGMFNCLYTLKDFLIGKHFIKLY